MLKLAFEYLTDSYSLLENPIDNYIIMAVVGFVAYLIAYNIVGWFYSADMIDGRGAGHILHWIIRFIVFVAIYYVVATVLRIYKWIAGVPMYVWWIVIASVIGLVVGVVIVKLVLHRKKRIHVSSYKIDEAS